MSNDIVIDDNTSVGDLRKAYEAMRNRALAAEKSAGELQAKDRASTVAELLTAKGVQGAAKAAGFYPADGEVNEKSVSAWVEENKDFLKVADPKAPADPATPSNTPSTTTPPADPAASADPNALAAQRLAAATAAGGQADAFGQSNPMGAPTVDADRLAQLTELMRTTPRTPEGYRLLAQTGVFPAEPGM